MQIYVVYSSSYIITPFMAPNVCFLFQGIQARRPLPSFEKRVTHQAIAAAAADNGGESSRHVRKFFESWIELRARKRQIWPTSLPPEIGLGSRSVCFHTALNMFAA